MKASPLITSLNAGELSPLMSGRSDISKYANGCRLLQNFIPRVQGPVTRRGGTRYVAATKDQSDRSWLVKFEFSQTQAWVLEFGDLYVRFYTQNGQVESSPGVPYEIVSPYAIADLTNADGTFALKLVQSGDVLYIANQKRTYAPRKLTRVAATNWVFSTYQPNQGPFLEMNQTAVTLSSAGISGNVTLTASAATFVASDVGRLVRLEVQDLSVVTPWETNKGYSIGDSVRYDGKTYIALNNATSGTSPPIHERGSAFDGKTGVEWDYQDSGYGVVRITAFVSTTEVDADVISDESSGLLLLPEDVQGVGTTRWQLGAWSAATEYPSSVTFFQQRLWWGGRQRLWASVPLDFENMAGDFFGQQTLDCAIWSQLQAEDVNDILWLSGDRVLVIGTPGGEFIGGEISDSQALGPGNFKMVRHSKRRVRAVQPVAVGDVLMMVQRAGRKLLGMNYRLESDTFASIDLSVLSDRMTRDGIIDMAWQAEPFSSMWCATASGRLLGFVHDRDQDVSGWHPHKIGGTGIVESVVCVPATSGLADELWMQVRRTINGGTKRYIEYMVLPWEGPDNDGSGGDDQEDAFYVDSGATYDGVPADEISGLDHLEGESVDILADGAVHPPLTVSGGEITLTYEASVVQVGLRAVARGVTNDLEAGGSSGTSIGKTARTYRAAVRVIDTLGGRMGRANLADLSQSGVLDPIQYRLPAVPMGEAPPIYSGIVDMDFPGDWEMEKCIEFVQDQPLPMTIAAIAPRLHSNDR